MKKQNKGSFFVMTVASIALAGGLLAAMKPAFAQGVIEQISEYIREKAGFGYSIQDDAFVFSKITPIYGAYAGDMATAGGHRIALARDGTSIDVSFLSATFESSPSAVLSDTSIQLSKNQLEVLSTAEQILLRQASGSGISMQAGERSILDDATGILNAIASPSGETATLPQQDQDFLLLVKLKSFKIQQLSSSVDKHLEQITKDVSNIIAKATMVEDASDRKVSFASIAPGLDMLYQLDANGIRQEIILASHNNIYTTISFRIKSVGLEYYDIGHGVWYFANREKKMLRIPKGWAKDASGAFTNDVNISIQNSTTQDTLTLRVAPDWIASAQRVFPITIFTAFEVIPELRFDRSSGNTPIASPIITSAPSILEDNAGEPSATDSATTESTTSSQIHQ